MYLLILPAAGSHQEELEVCYAHKDGSQWRGELGELDQHLKVSY